MCLCLLENILEFVLFDIQGYSQIWGIISNSAHKSYLENENWDIGIPLSTYQSAIFKFFRQTAMN